MIDDNRTRLAATALGGTLLAAGLRRRSLGGAVLAIVGGWLCYRALGGSSGETRVEESVPVTGHEREVIGEDDETDGERRPSVEQSITIGADADELYERARDPETMDRLVGRFADVTPVSEDRHRWTVQTPLGRELEWETEIVDDRPGELLRWEADGAPLLSMSGSLRFQPAPGDRGTEVILEERIDPPGGPVGDAALSALGVVPEALTSHVLDRFKSLVETGDIPTTEHNPSARGSGDLV